jgi:hypothetical protein
MKINEDYEIYVEHCVGEISIGWRFYSNEPYMLQKVEEVGIERTACWTDYNEAPDEVLQAIKILKQ